MSTETIDIVIKESGAAVAKENIAGIGPAATESAAAVDVLGGAMEKLNGIFAMLGLAVAAKAIFDVTQEWSKMANQLRQVTDSAAEFSAVQKSLFDVSQQTFTSVKTNVESYKELSESLNTTSHSAQGVVEIIKNVDAYTTAAGKSSESAAGLISALALGMEKGTLSGRPLLAIMRENKDMMNGLAAAAGVTVPEFQRMATAGEITSAKMYELLTSSKFASSAMEAMSKAQITVAQATEVLKNSFGSFLTQLDQSSGASRMLASGLLLIAQHIPGIITALEGMALAWGLVKAQALLAAAATTIATGGLNLILPLIAIAATYMANFGNEIKLTADGSITLQGALVGTFNYLMQAASDAVKWISDICTQINAAADATVQWIVNSQLIQGIISLWNMLSDAVKEAWGWIDKIGQSLGLWAASAPAQVQGVTDKVTGLVKAMQDASAQPPVLAGAFDAAATKITSDLSGVDSKLKAVADSTSKAGSAAQTAAQQYASLAKAMASASGGGGGGGGGSNSPMKSSSKDPTDLMANHGAQYDPTGWIAQQAAQNGGSSGGSNGMTAQDYSNIAAITIGNQPWQPPSYFNPGDGATGASYDQTYNSGNITGMSSSGSTDTGNSSSDMGYFAAGGDFTVGGQGGTDSQMIKFMATPGEQVTVRTPSQSHGTMTPGAGGDTHVAVHMTVNAADANSFNLSQKTMAMQLQSELTRALRSIG